MPHKSKSRADSARANCKPRMVLLTADDFGLSDGVSRCVAELLAAGVVSRTSVMPCEAATPRLCAEYAQAIRGRAGCHLQAHKSRPVLPPEEIKSLVTRDRVFKSSTFAHEMLAGELLSEWTAQIELLKALGIDPTHLDTHHHVHRDPRLLRVLSEVAQRFALPIRRTGEAQLDEGASVEFVSERMTQAWTLTGRPAEDLVEELLTPSWKSGVTEVVCHPAYPDEELRSKTSASDIRAVEQRELRRLPDLLRGVGLQICAR